MPASTWNSGNVSSAGVMVNLSHLVLTHSPLYEALRGDRRQLLFLFHQQSCEYDTICPDYFLVLLINCILQPTYEYYKVSYNGRIFSVPAIVSLLTE